MIQSLIDFLKEYEILAIIPFLLGFGLKILMDLNLGTLIVKYFYWISFRSIYRKQAIKISGIYKQHWSYKNNAKNFNKISDRQSLITLKQLNNYCYGEFKSKEDVYYLFGEIIDRKIIGHWADKKTKIGYFGSFELTIVGKSTIEGYWIGHSNQSPNILNMQEWKLKSVTDNTKWLVPIQLKIFFKRTYSFIVSKIA